MRGYLPSDDLNMIVHNLDLFVHFLSQESLWYFRSGTLLFKQPYLPHSTWICFSVRALYSNIVLKWSCIFCISCGISKSTTIKCVISLKARYDITGHKKPHLNSASVFSHFFSCPLRMSASSLHMSGGGVLLSLESITFFLLAWWPYFILIITTRYSMTSSFIPSS